METEEPLMNATYAGHHITSNSDNGISRNLHDYSAPGTLGTLGTPATLKQTEEQPRKRALSPDPVAAQEAVRVISK